MEALDWLVIGVFFLALIGIIVWVVRQKQNDSAESLAEYPEACVVLDYTLLDCQLVHALLADELLLACVLSEEEI